MRLLNAPFGDINSRARIGSGAVGAGVDKERLAVDPHRVAVGGPEIGELG